MKKMFIVLTALMCVLVLTGCKDDGVKPQLIPTEADCMFMPFVETYKKWYSESEDAYLVKGIAGDIVNKCGFRVKLIEDLKGNFPKNVTEFTMYGDYPCFIELNRIDYLPDYATQDTMILLLSAAPNWYKYDLPDDHGILEKVGDYVTVTCVPSVLELSDNYVAGYILPHPVTVHDSIVHKDIDYFEMIVDTISFDDLKKMLELNK